MMTHLLLDNALMFAFGIPGSWEWIIVLIIGLLIFGRKLPDVGRWLGQGIVEFKKGIKGIEDDIEDASTSRPVDSRDPERLDEDKQREHTGTGAASGQGGKSQQSV